MSLSFTRKSDLNPIKFDCLFFLDLLQSLQPGKGLKEKILSLIFERCKEGEDFSLEYSIIPERRVYYPFVFYLFLNLECMCLRKMRIFPIVTNELQSSMCLW